MELLNKIIPHVMANTSRLFDSILQTLRMTLWSGAVMFVCGLALGVILTVTKDCGILRQRVVSRFSTR
ncbi:MAG: hypothetical protein K2J77_07525 [Oscillospiraceae bacterium]|nr:hypothetical protein [Oscillospiraceae bacterium]